MADYAKLELTATYSEKSGFDPVLEKKVFDAYKLEPDAVVSSGKTSAVAGAGAAGSGTTIWEGTTSGTSIMTTGVTVVVKNLGTNKVAVLFTPIDDADLTGLNPNPVTAQYVVLDAPASGTAGDGGLCILTNVDPTADIELVANSAATDCAFWILGT